MKKKIVILYSGGLDSLIMSHFAEIAFPEAEVIKVYFDLGHDYAYKEIEQLPDDCHVHDMKWFSAKGVGKGEGDTLSNDIFIPGRNMVMAVNAACKYLPDEIWLGALQGEMHDNATDKNQTFATKLNDTLKYVLSPYKDSVEVVFPLADSGMDKLSATAWGLDMGLEDEIVNSSSCLSGEEGNCGHCVVCVRRWGIFKQLGLEETYNVDVLSHPDNKKILLDMVSSDPHYDHHRVGEIRPAIESVAGTTDNEELKLFIEGLQGDKT